MYYFRLISCAASVLHNAALFQKCEASSSEVPSLGNNHFLFIQTHRFLCMTSLLTESMYNERFSEQERITDTKFELITDYNSIISKLFVSVFNYSI